MGQEGADGPASDVYRARRVRYFLRRITAVISSRTYRLEVAQAKVNRHDGKSECVMG
jgi:hypothetical protein